MKLINSQESVFPEWVLVSFEVKRLATSFRFLLLYLCCAFYHQITKRLQKGEYRQKKGLLMKKRNGEEREGLCTKMRLENKKEREQYGGY